MNPGAVIVFGAGDGLGAALAHRFAAGGHPLFPVARNHERLERLVDSIRASGGQAVPLAADVLDRAAITEVFDQVELQSGAIDVVLFNVAPLLRKQPCAETTAEDFEAAWRLGCLAGFDVGQEAARRMTPRGRGTLIFTGATASLRGGANFIAFAAAKAGLRSVAQSLARELGPKGIHVAHVVVDGIINTAAIRERFPDYVAGLPPDGALLPEAMAETYFALHHQPRSAWTHEIDLRPWCETF